MQNPDRFWILILSLLLCCPTALRAQEDDGLSRSGMMDIAERIRLNPDSTNLQSLISEMELVLPDLVRGDSADWVNQMLAPGKRFRNSAPQEAGQYFGSLHAKASVILPGNPGLIRIRAFEAEANLKAGQLYPALNGFEDCLEKLERRMNAGSRVDSAFTALLYHKAGNIHFRLWDRRQAETFLERSIALNGQVGRKDRKVKAICDRNLIWLQDGRSTEVIKLAEQWIDNPATPDLQKGILLSQLAEASFLLGDKARFEKEADKASATFHDLGAGSSVAEVELLRARVARHEGDYPKSLRYLESALQRETLRDRALGKVLIRQAELLDVLEDYEAARGSFRKGVSAILDLESFFGHPLNWEISQLENLPMRTAEPWLVRGFAGWSRVEMKAGDFGDAVTLLRLCMDRWDDMRALLNSDESRFYIGGTARPALAGNIEQVARMNDMSRNHPPIENLLFYCFARSQSMVLNDAISERGLLEQYKVPEKLLSRKRLLEEHVTYNDYDLSADSLHQLWLELRSLTDSLEKAFPVLIEARPDIIPEIEEFRQSLGPDALYIAYFLPGTSFNQLEEQSPLAMALSQEDIFVLPVDTSGLAKWQQVVSDINRSAAEIQSTGHSLYQGLLEPLLERSEGKSQLIINPDGAIGSCPFEALCTELIEDPQLQNLPYLIRNWQLSYRQGLRLENEWADVRPTRSFGGFAPWQSDAPLPRAEEEVSAVSELMGGTTFVAGEASRKNFLNRAGNFRVLHVAAHGIPDPQEPWASALHFSPDDLSDGRLLVADIRAMKIPAELAVLSSCRSGDGKGLTGEGLMSLSRAFMQAGCQSVVSSRWEVDDQFTADFMLEFYQALNNGRGRATAIRDAQLINLRPESDPLNAHPALWASFMQVGDDRPLGRGLSGFQNNRSVLFGALSGLLLGAFCLLWIKSKGLSPGPFGKG